VLGKVSLQRGFWKPGNQLKDDLTITLNQLFVVGRLLKTCSELASP